MRFADLDIGDLFSFQGNPYVKVSTPCAWPLDENGCPKLDASKVWFKKGDVVVKIDGHLEVEVTPNDLDRYQRILTESNDHTRFKRIYPFHDLKVGESVEILVNSKDFSLGQRRVILAAHAYGASHDLTFTCYRTKKGVMVCRIS